MKKAFLIAATCFVTLTSPTYAGVPSQSISFTGPANWVPGTQVTLDVSLTFTGYSSIGFDHYIDVSSQISPFLSVVSVTYFAPFSHGSPGPWPLNSDFGSNNGSPQNPPAPPGTYHTTSIIFALAAGAPLGHYTISTSTVNPRASLVSDSEFNEYPIPAATFNFDVVPEPGTFALLGLGIVGGSLFLKRRRKQS